VYNSSSKAEALENLPALKYFLAKEYLYSESELFKTLWYSPQAERERTAIKRRIFLIE
jgi:hypothetical protein